MTRAKAVAYASIPVHFFIIYLTPSPLAPHLYLLCKFPIQGVRRNIMNITSKARIIKC